VAKNAKAAAAAKKAADLPASVVPFEQYEVATMDRKELKSLMAETLGSLELTEFDLERITVPGSGGITWEIMNAEGETDAVKYFDAIILNFKSTRSFYEESYEESGGGAPPICSSNDGHTGVGVPGGNCQLCPNAQFGSKEDGRGQACTQNMILFIIRENEIMPSIVKIPPTSIRDIKRAIAKIAFQKRVHYYHGLVRFCLVKEQSKTGVTYSAVKLKFLGAIKSKNGQQIANELHTGITPLIEGGNIGGQLMAPPSQQQLAAPSLLNGEDVTTEMEVAKTPEAKAPATEAKEPTTQEAATEHDFAGEESAPKTEPHAEDTVEDFI